MAIKKEAKMLISLVRELRDLRSGDLRSGKSSISRMEFGCTSIVTQKKYLTLSDGRSIEKIFYRDAQDCSKLPYPVTSD